MMLVSFLLFIATASASTPPAKPEWPLVFDVPFGFNDKYWIPSFKNVSSHFYYNWHLKSQLIDYPERCFPFESLGASSHPCKMLFNEEGVFYQSTQRHVQCCSFIKGVGAVPPDFLRAYNYSGVVRVPDYWGVMRDTLEWAGPAKFSYWTDSETGRDVQLTDGPTGIKWNFGAFSSPSTAHNASLFHFGGDCSQKCSKLLRAPELTHKDVLHVLSRGRSL